MIGKEDIAQDSHLPSWVDSLSHHTAETDTPGAQEAEVSRPFPSSFHRLEMRNIWSPLWSWEEPEIFLVKPQLPKGGLVRCGHKLIWKSPSTFQVAPFQSRSPPNILA